MSTTYHVYCLSQSLSLMSHAMGTVGNESVINTESLPDRSIVPVLSGNAIRHRMVRAPGARYLIDRLALRGKLSLEQVNYLFHGGALTEGGNVVDLGRIAEGRELFPLLKLVGGCLPNQIISGSLKSHRGLLVCSENADRIEKSLPLGFVLPQPLRRANECITRYQYVRSDARVSSSDMVQATNGDASAQMIYAGSAVSPGSYWWHGFTIPFTHSIVELGCLLHCLEQWDNAGSCIGGMSGRGHGRLSTSILIDPSTDYLDAVTAYANHVDDHADKCRSWLESAFAPKAKSVKTRKSKSTEEVTA